MQHCSSTLANEMNVTAIAQDDRCIPANTSTTRHDTTRNEIAGNVRTCTDMGWMQLFREKYKTRALWMDQANQRVTQTTIMGHTDRVRHVRVRAENVMSASWDGSVRLANLRDKSGTSRVLGGNLGTVRVALCVCCVMLYSAVLFVRFRRRS
jgi:hypothetical protein